MSTLGGGSAALPSTPAAAGAVFGDRLGLAERYVAHLATSGLERGLIGPREVPILWERHVLNSVAAAGLMPEYSSVVDVGSGAGLPGIPLALARPDLDVVLVESMQRRVDWLQEVLMDLAVANVDVRRGRAEEMGRELRADVVTARAVARLDVLAQWCLPLLTPGGVMLALKGETAAAELEETRAAVSAAGGEAAEAISLPVPGSDQSTWVVRIRRATHPQHAQRGRRR